MKIAFLTALFTAGLSASAWAGHCNSDHAKQDHDQTTDAKPAMSEGASAMTTELKLDNESEISNSEPAQVVEAVEEEQKPKSRYSKYYR